MALTRDYIVRGITCSDRDPSHQADLHRSFVSGWFAGLSAVTARLGQYVPISAELAPYVGVGRAQGKDWPARVTAKHYDYPGSESRDPYRYDEIAADLGWRNHLYLGLAL